jgi:hypothetical protein
VRNHRRSLLVCQRIPLASHLRDRLRSRPANLQIPPVNLQAGPPHSHLPNRPILLGSQVRNHRRSLLVCQRIPLASHLRDRLRSRPANLQIPPVNLQAGPPHSHLPNRPILLGSQVRSHRRSLLVSRRIPLASHLRDRLRSRPANLQIPPVNLQAGPPHSHLPNRPILLGSQVRSHRRSLLVSRRIPLASHLRDQLRSRPANRRTQLVDLRTSHPLSHQAGPHLSLARSLPILPGNQALNRHHSLAHSQQTLQASHLRNPRRNHPASLRIQLVSHPGSPPLNHHRNHLILRASRPDNLPRSLVRSLPTRRGSHRRSLRLNQAHNRRIQQASHHRNLRPSRLVNRRIPPVNLQVSLPHNHRPNLPILLRSQALNRRHSRARSRQILQASHLRNPRRNHPASLRIRLVSHPGSPPLNHHRNQPILRASRRDNLPRSLVVNQHSRQLNLPASQVGNRHPFLAASLQVSPQIRPDNLQLSRQSPPLVNHQVSRRVYQLSRRANRLDNQQIIPLTFRVGNPQWCRPANQRHSRVVNLVTDRQDSRPNSHLHRHHLSRRGCLAHNLRHSHLLDLPINHRTNPLLSLRDNHPAPPVVSLQASQLQHPLRSLRTCPRLSLRDNQHVFQRAALLSVRKTGAKLCLTRDEFAPMVIAKTTVPFMENAFITATASATWAWTGYQSGLEQTALCERVHVTGPGFLRLWLGPTICRLLLSVPIRDFVTESLVCVNVSAAMKVLLVSVLHVLNTAMETVIAGLSDIWQKKLGGFMPCHGTQ